MKEFQTKKKFGQNFITDKNLLSAIVSDAEITSEDEVLEIGPGLGTLTEEISKTAKRVISYEIDKELQPILLAKKLENVEFRFKDIMDVSLKEIEESFSNEYKIVANLPYYITTPILFKFIGQSNKVKSITVMVQKEVAERMIAKEGGKDYGVLSIGISACGEAHITRNVSRNMFNPAPNVDSAVVRIDLYNKYNIDLKEFHIFVKNIFNMRRKTLLNNLVQAYGLKRDQLEKIFSVEELSRRAESFSIDEIIDMFKKFNNR